MTRREMILAEVRKSLAIAGGKLPASFFSHEALVAIAANPREFALLTEAGTGERVVCRYTLRTSYTTRQGWTVPVCFFSEEQARQRLAYLDADEARTREVAPTDSGDVRHNYNREAEAIRALLKIS